MYPNGFKVYPDGLKVYPGSCRRSTRQRLVEKTLLAIFPRQDEIIFPKKKKLPFEATASSYYIAGI
jgi:hypothetical protein